MLKNLLKDFNWIKFVLIASGISIVATFILAIICLILSFVTQVFIAKKNVTGTIGISIAQLILYFLAVVLIVGSVIAISAADMMQSGSMSMKLVKGIGGGALGLPADKMDELPGKLLKKARGISGGDVVRFAKSDTGKALGKGALRLFKK